jgi:hypothetical protein
MVSKKRIVVCCITALLLCGCEKSREAAVPDVEVKREIVQDTLTSWTMHIHSSFGLYSINFNRLRKPDRWFTFERPEEAQRVFDTFLRWSGAAENNKVEPFSKTICDRCVVSIVNDRSSHVPGIFEFKNGRAYLDEFNRQDIEKFSELLKQFPEANADFQSKLAKAKSEAQLFK